jgi:hypothetical protein
MPVIITIITITIIWGDLGFHRKFVQGHSEGKITHHYTAICDDPCNCSVTV